MLRFLVGYRERHKKKKRSSIRNDEDSKSHFQNPQTIYFNEN